MKLRDLKSLIKLVTETDITEFKMEDKEGKILIKRGAEKEITHISAPAVPVSVAAPMLPGSPVLVPATAAAAEPATDERYDTVTSPMVGTIYHKPSPEAVAFVTVGAVIEAGQTLCLVEAMKMYNEIEAEFKCKIIEIVRADATPVEFGETLFIVERL